MDAVQRMRTKAKDAGKLESNEQMKVETQQVESKTIVVIEQASPEVVYVPSYNPAIIWGTVGYYPYPPIYYRTLCGPLRFRRRRRDRSSLGRRLGLGRGWGNNDININRNNNFNRNTNINGGNRVNPLGSGNNRWQHNPQHRGGAPYANRDIANRFGGAARGDSIANRQANARQNLGARQAGTMDRSGLGGGNRGTSAAARWQPRQHGWRQHGRGPHWQPRRFERCRSTRQRLLWGWRGSWGGGAPGPVAHEVLPVWVGGGVGRWYGGSGGGGGMRGGGGGRGGGGRRR